jgi:hypothetical protein
VRENYAGRAATAAHLEPAPKYGCEIRLRGKRRVTVCDNGPECISKHFDAWLSRTRLKQRDIVMCDEIRRVHRENFGVYGQCQTWLQLLREVLSPAAARSSV